MSFHLFCWKRASNLQPCSFFSFFSFGVGNLCLGRAWSSVCRIQFMVHIMRNHQSCQIMAFLIFLYNSATIFRNLRSVRYVHPSKDFGTTKAAMTKVKLGIAHQANIGITRRFSTDIPVVRLRNNSRIFPRTPNPNTGFSPDVGHVYFLQWSNEAVPS